MTLIYNDKEINVPDGADFLSLAKRAQVDYDGMDLSRFTVIENNGTEQELKEKIKAAFAIKG